MPSLSARIRPHLLQLTGLMGLCILVLLPTLVRGGPIGHPISDMPDHYWGSWFFGSELLAGEWPGHSDISHLPEGGSLWVVDPIGGFLALFLRPLGFPHAWNGALLIQLIAASWAGYWLGFSELGSKSAGWISGMICGVCPFALGLLHSGLSEYLGLVWPTLFLLFLLKCYRHECSPYIPALLLFGATLQAAYYGLFGVLLALCMLAGRRLKTHAPLFFRLAGAWALLSLPLFWMIRKSLRSDDALVNAKNAPGWEAHSLPSIDIWSWIRPGDWVHPPTPELGNPGILHVNYLGLVVLALALLGIWKNQKLRVLRPGTALFGLFCMGPRLSWGGKAFGLLLPMALLYALPFSPFRAIHHPYRIAAFLTPLIALWAAAGLLTISKPWRFVLPGLILLDFILLSPVPYPLKQSTIPDISLYEQAESGAILDFPPELSSANRSYTLAQVHHGLPIAYGVNRFLSAQLKSDPLVNQMLQCMQNPHRLARNRDIPPKEPVIIPPVGSHRGSASLRALGFNTIMVHEAFLRPKESRCIKRLLADHTLPIQTSPTHSLYKTR